MNIPKEIKAKILKRAIAKSGIVKNISENFSANITEENGKYFFWYNDKNDSSHLINITDLMKDV